jgi:DNA-binding XRE family transcriptional regulator
MNPLKQARLASGLTQKNLAIETGMTPHAILRYEQGLYDALSPKLSLYASQHLQILPSEVEQSYHEFQLERRRQSAQYFIPFPHLTLHPHEPPFIYFRNSITTRAVGKKTRIGFCILLAMNPAVVLQYERGLARHLPLLVSGALKDAGVSDGHIKDLDSYGEIWSERYGGND